MRSATPCGCGPTPRPPPRPSGGRSSEATSRRWLRPSSRSPVSRLGRSPLSTSRPRDRLSRQKPEGLGLRANPVYARVFFLSSFFEWAMRELALRGQIGGNPARLALPKAPKAYQTESVKAWTDEQLQTIVEAVRSKAAAGEIVGKRDYALLLFYLVTGMRRQEVIGLRGGDIRIEEVHHAHGQGEGWRLRRQGGARPTAAGGHTRLPHLVRQGGGAEDRRAALDATRPPGEAGGGTHLTCLRQEPEALRARSRTGDVHLHQTRHTFGRIVAEETGSMTATQDALGHRNAATTRVYVQRIAVKRDLHSGRVTSRLKRP